MRQVQLRSHAFRASILALAVAASPVLASAQQPAPAAPRSVMYTAAPAGARLNTTKAPATADRAAATDAVRMERHVGAGKNAALMVVGAAGIVTGILVGGGGGAAIAVGGAVVGLYGLYNFVK